MNNMPVLAKVSLNQNNQSSCEIASSLKDRQELTVVALSEKAIAFPINWAPNSRLCMVKTRRALLRP